MSVKRPFIFFIPLQKMGGRFNRFELNTSTRLEEIDQALQALRKENEELRKENEEVRKDIAALKEYVRSRTFQQITRMPSYRYSGMGTMPTYSVGEAQRKLGE
jgi:regulator of replication initiation timing